MAKWMYPSAKPARTGARLVVTVSAAALLASGALFAGVAGATVISSITTVAGNGTAGSTGDGAPAVKAELNAPTGVTEDLVGSLYIGDTANNEVRKILLPTTINKDIISTIAGTGVAGFSGDGGEATSATLLAPSGVAVDSKGDVFIADTGNNRIREINTSGIINTIAGTGQCVSNMNNNEIGNGGPATLAQLCLRVPTGIALDSKGDLFVSDTLHNQLREILTNGNIILFAGKGSPGSSGDGGPATKALLNGPTGVAVDALGNVYIADTGNSKVRVVNPSGTISTFAGTGVPGFSGDGGPASNGQLSFPTGVGVDPSGNVYISDTGNQRIRLVNPSATISTYGGNGTRGFSDDGGPATAAALNTPTGNVAADGVAVYFGDTGNQRVRGIFTGPPPVL